MSYNGLVSVIVPNYNNAHYLPQCIDSILQQSYKHIEIVIVDDNSSDDSRMILQEYNREHDCITVIYNLVNQGVTKNRDMAIKVAKGTYLTTLDSDDYFMDGQKLEKEMEIIKKREEAGEKNIIAFSNIVLVDDQGEKLSSQNRNPVREGDILPCIYARSCVIPRDFIFSRQQYLDAGGYDLDIPLYEDWDLKLRLAGNNKFYYTGINGIAYRRHGTGLSSIHKEEHFKWLQYIYDKNLGLLESVPEKEKESIRNGFNAFLNINVASGTKPKSLIKRLLKKIVGQ